MPTLTANYQFAIGETVTLNSMLAMQKTQGSPRVFVVRYVRAIQTAAAVDISYYCRALASSRWRDEQAMLSGEATLNGLVLLDEDELVAYTPTATTAQ